MTKLNFPARRVFRPFPLAYSYSCSADSTFSLHPSASVLGPSGNGAKCLWYWVNKLMHTDNRYEQQNSLYYSHMPKTLHYALMILTMLPKGVYILTEGPSKRFPKEPVGHKSAT